MRSSTFAAVLKALAVTALLVAVFLFFFPEYRISLFGIRMAYEAPQEDKRNLMLALQVSEGREVRGKDADGEVGLADTAKLGAALEETTLSKGAEFLLDYKLTQVQSEQFAWNQPHPGKLAGFHWQGRVSGKGSLSAVKLEERSNALWAREDVAWLWMSALWNPLPEKRLSPGDTWTGEVRAFATIPEKPEGFALILRPTYTLDRVRYEGGKTLLEYHWEGTVESDGGGGAIKGKIEGRAVNSIDDKRGLLAEFKVDMSGELPLAVPKGMDESDGMKVGWRQKVEGRILRMAPPSQTPSPSPTP